MWNDFYLISIAYFLHLQVEVYGGSEKPSILVDKDEGLGKVIRLDVQFFLTDLYGLSVV